MLPFHSLISFTYNFSISKEGSMKNKFLRCPHIRSVYFFVIFSNFFVSAVAMAGLAIDGVSDFGSVPVGKSKTLVFTLRNTGLVTLKYLSVANATPPWNFVSTTCSPSLGAYKTCDLLMIFSPTTEGNYTETIRIQFKQSLFYYVSTKAAKVGIAVIPPSPTPYLLPRLHQCLHRLHHLHLLHSLLRRLHHRPAIANPNMLPTSFFSILRRPLLGTDDCR
jgi:hypothetical protein